MNTFQALGGFVAAISLVAMFFPSLVALIRGARENHMGGIMLLNAASVAAVIAGGAVTALLGVALMPFCAVVLFLLTAWAFAAPGRVADRLAARRHAELLVALGGAPSPAPIPGPRTGRAWQ